MKLRAMIVKPAMIGSNLSNILLMIGFATSMSGLVCLGIIGFSIGVLFSLVTLPVELDASKRAVVALQEVGIITPAEARTPAPSCAPQP